MKIIHITPSYKPAFIYGGTIKSVALLCEMFVKAGKNIEVLSTTANGKTELPGKKAAQQLVDNVPVTYFKRITKDHTHFSPALLWRLFLLSAKNEKVLVHIHSWWNFTSLLACIIAKINRNPIVVSPRGMLTAYTFKHRNTRLKFMLHYFIGRRLLRSVTIHATSEKEKQDLLKIDNMQNITVIPNLINEIPENHNDSLKLETADESPFRMIFLSRIEEKKGLELLLSALSNLPFDWRLSIAGSGQSAYISKLKQLIKELNFESSIDWLGQINDYEKYRLIGSHQLMVLFSHNENFANAIAESLSVGTPVAISDQIGLASFVIHHDLGWVSDLNQENIAKELIKAHHDLQKRTRIRKIAPALISEHFSTKGLFSQYVNLYQNAL